MMLNPLECRGDRTLDSLEPQHLLKNKEVLQNFGFFFQSQEK